MGNVNADGIWTPDEEDTLEADVWSSQMAESISQGLGVRMEKQEKTAGIKAQIGTYELSGVNKIPALTIHPTVGFNNQMTLTGGVVKVKVAGFYLIVATVTARFEDGVPIDANLWVNGENASTQPFETSLTSYTGTSMVHPALLQIGDTFHVTVGVGADQPDVVTMSNVVFSAAMIYAT